MLLVCDLTKKESLQHAKRLLLDIREKSNTKFSTLLLANKSDMNFIRELPGKELLEFKAAYGVPFTEVSAFSGDGLKEAVSMLLDEICELIIDTRGSIPNSSTADNQMKGRLVLDAK